MLYSWYILLLALTNHDAAPLRDPAEQVGSIPRSHHILPLSVNVYPESLIRTRYYETTKQTGATENIPLENLFLEISEKLPIPLVDDIANNQHPIEAFREKLYRFMDLGMRFSIDDFGVGYASSSRLSRLGSACIKIDRDALSDKFGHFTFSYVLGLARGCQAIHRLSPKVSIRKACFRSVSCMS